MALYDKPAKKYSRNSADFYRENGIFVVAQSGFRDIYTDGMIGYERRRKSGREV